MRTASLLAALETKAVKLSDTIDVDNGILAIGKDTLCDHNWHRSGYEKSQWSKVSDLHPISPITRR